MLDSLRMIFDRLIEQVDTTYHRFLYPAFNLNSRLTGLVGPRGVGKTTLLLQYIKEHDLGQGKAFYFSADHLYFKEVTLYHFVEELFLKQSIEFFFIDEIHKYDNWSQELKNLYDGFPSIKIVFSGSSSLDLVKGGYDLSRRAIMHYLPGLSFREYLNFSTRSDYQRYTFDELMKNYMAISREIGGIPAVLGHFQDYLQQGFYPFFQEDPLSYYQKISSIVEKTIYEDITNFYNIKTVNLIYFSKILNYLASVPPGNISTYNIGKNLGVDDKTASHYLTMLNETGLVEIIYAAEGGNLSLRRPEKIFFNNTNLHYALGGHLTRPVDIGTIRELAFIQSTTNAGLDVYHSKEGDYKIGRFVFEIGGKNKTRKQVKAVKDAFLVKDGTVAAMKGAIPLYYFGFLY